MPKTKPFSRIDGAFKQTRRKFMGFLAGSSVMLATVVFPSEKMDVSEVNSATKLPDQHKQRAGYFPWMGP